MKQIEDMTKDMKEDMNSIHTIFGVNRTSQGVRPFVCWKYMFSPVQYRQTGRILLRIFPNRPRSSVQMQYNSSYVFNELDKINTLRNRIAHHEPICFPAQGDIIYTDYIRNEYVKILSLLEWLGIDSKKYLYGLDHVMVISDKIDKLKPV